MNKLRINRTDIYEIEVNDNGDKIRFDLKDVDLPFKLQRAFDGAKKAQKELEKKIAQIAQQEDSKGEDDLLSANEFALAEARSEAFASMRKAMDEFLGEGGCQKIFGDTNYIDMYDDLFDELSKPQEDGKSHLEHMELSAAGIRKRIEDKYGNQQSGVLK